jgi:hypothetical protein
MKFQVFDKTDVWFIGFGKGTHWNSIQDVLESSTEFLLNWAMVQIWVYRFVSLQLQSRGKYLV